MTGGRSEKAMIEARKLYRTLDERFLNSIAPSTVQDGGKLRFGVLCRMVTVSLGLIVFSQLSGFSAVMYVFSNFCQSISLTHSRFSQRRENCGQSIGLTGHFRKCF
eukprot:sb/3477787/